MKKTKCRGIVIDVYTQEVREVWYSSIKDMCKEMKCNIIAVGLNMGNGNTLYVDDNGYITGPMKYFKLKSSEPMQWLAGNGFIASEDESGFTNSSIDIEKLKADVVFMQCDDRASCPKLASPTIISW